MADSLMIVMSNVVPGREDEFNAWYNDEHIIDVVEKLDGFVSAQRYELSERQLEPTQFRYMAVYRIPEGQMATAQASILMQRAERAEALAAGRRPLLTVSDTMAEPHFSWFFVPLNEQLNSSVKTERGNPDTDELMVVFSNVADGREDEFNEWYSGEHITDVVDKLDGFVNAQRWELASEQLEPTQFRYVAIYHVPAGQLDLAQDQILMQRDERAEALAAGRRPMLTVSDSMVAPRFSWFFKPLTGEVRAGGS